MTWCHHYQITLKARHIPGCLNVMADLLSRSKKVQSTEWSLHPQVFKQICLKWFTPHVDLFCHSPEPQSSTIRVSSPRPKCLGHRCSEHKLVGSHCLYLPSNSSPSQGDPKNQAIQLPDHCISPRLARDALVLGPSAALNRDPTSSVKNSSQTVPQHLNISVEVWALFEKWCRENSVDFSTPSVKQVSDFFMYLYQDLNRRSSTIDGYRMAIVDTLGQTGLHISQSLDLYKFSQGSSQKFQESS